MFGATKLLHNVGALLARVLRNSDLRCRYGGDEFLVMLPDTPLIGANRWPNVEAEIATLEVAAGGKRISVMASVGVAAATPGEINVTNFIDRVDSGPLPGQTIGPQPLLRRSRSNGLRRSRGTGRQPPK